MWAWLSACTQAPPPDRAWTLSLHGQPVGVEREWRTRDGVRRERLVRVLADGAVHERRTVVTLDLAPNGPVSRWSLHRADLDASGVGPVWDPWSAPPPASGTVPLLDEVAGRIVTRAVERDPEGLRWDTSAGPVVVTLVDGRVDHGTWAGTAFERAPTTAPDPEPLDVAAVLSRPAPAFAAPRRSVVGVWEVDGVEVRVDSPLLLELPPAARTLGTLAREVSEEVADAGAPFGGGPDGDCTEHAERFLVRARETGWEARPAAGWLYVAEPEPRLWLHAWAEVRVGEAWVAVDPTLGQFPADAGHLKVGTWPQDVAHADGAVVTIRDLR